MTDVSLTRAIAEAFESGRDLRVHTADGEVLVARVLQLEAGCMTYAPVTSSHPERYAVCDSTGFTLKLTEIERVQPLRTRLQRAR